MAEIQTVGVVGAGTMGSGIAHVFARAGFRVLLCDVEQRFLERALTQIRTNLGREAAKGKLSEAEVEPALARIVPTGRGGVCHRGCVGAVRAEVGDLPRS